MNRRNITPKKKKKFSKSVSLLCWAYNEEAAIEDFLRRADALLSSTLREYEIVLVDDCSTDSTPEILKRLQPQMPSLRVIRNPKNLNVGLSSQVAIKNASKEYLFWQTVDWSYDIGKLSRFLDKLNTYDVVIGVRVRLRRAPRLLFFLSPLFDAYSLLRPSHLKARSDNLKKAIISIVNFSIIRTLFPIPVSDVQNVHFYPTKLIQSFPVESSSSFGGAEYIFKSYWNGCSIAEVPIPFIPRKIGKSKLPACQAVAMTLKDITTLWFRWIVLKRRPTRKGRVAQLDKREWDLPRGF